MKRKLLFALPTLALLAACGREAPSAPPPDIRPVRAEQVGRHAVDDSVRYAGEVHARHETDLAFRVAGRVRTRLVELGATVRPGEVLATLDPQDYALAARASEAQRVAAEAEARLARQELQRYTELRAQNFISEAELDRRRATTAAALAREAQLRAEAQRQGNQQSYTRLTASHAGVITAIDFEAGQVVAAGQPVAQLARTGELEVHIDVPENALDELREADTLTIRLWSDPDVRYPGRLRELSPMADPNSRTYRARVAFTKPDAAVKLGMTATVEVSRAHAPRLSVPQTALFRLGGRPQVWIVDPVTHRVAARAVEVGTLTGDRAELPAGIRQGEWVVTAGVHKLAPGQQVRLAPAAR